jgi:hypothetical protein
MKRAIILVLALILALIGVSVSWAANNLSGVPIVVDTFGSDVEIFPNRVEVETIVITAYTSDKTITFIDSVNGNPVLVLECPAGSTISWPVDGKSKPFPLGMDFDDSASDLAAGDFIFIWRK